VWDNIALSVRGPCGLLATLRARTNAEQIEHWLRIIKLQGQANERVAQVYLQRRVSE